MLVDSHYGMDRLRRSFLYFVTGRGAAGLLGIAILMMQVRLLKPSDYGAYVALFAIFELVVAITTFGLDWIGLRFIPDYRVNGGKAIHRFLLGLCSLRLVSLLAGAAAWFIAIMPALNHLGLESYEPAFVVFGVVVVTEGMVRFLVTVVFDSLLAQAQAQAVMVVRNLVYAAFLLTAVLGYEVPHLEDIVRWEMISSITGLVVALFLFAWLTVKENSAPVPGWIAPDRTALMSLGLHMYLSLLLALLYSSQVFMVLATRLLGLEAAALYGFARNVGEVVRKILPAQLLAGLIRPAVLARFAQGGSFAQLNTHAGYIYLASLLALLPLLVVFGVVGSELARLLSSGKFAESNWLIFAVLITFVPYSHRIVLELVVTAVRRADLWSRAALIGTMSLPLAIALTAWTSLGVYGLVLAAFLAEVTANVNIVKGLRSAGYDYSFDWARLFRLCAAGLAGIALVLPSGPMGALDMVVKVAIGLILTFLVVWKLRVLSATELSAIRQFLPEGK